MAEQVHEEDVIEITEDGMVDVDLDEVDEVVERARSERSEDWYMLGRSFPRSEIKFFAQIIVLYMVIVTCLINLSLGKSHLDSLWISLLSSCIGYMLPAPYISRKNKEQTRVTA